MKNLKRNCLKLVFSNIRFLLIAYVLVGCSAEGDIHPELKDIYSAVEESTGVEWDFVFDAQLQDIEIIGAYLFVYYPVYTYDADSVREVDFLQCEVLKNGEPHHAFSFDKERISNPFIKNKRGDVYVGNVVIYAPNYDEHESLTIIEPSRKAESLAMLQTLIEPAKIKFEKQHFDLLGDIEDYSNTDSLKNELMYGYQNDWTHIDSAYREHLFFFLYDAKAYAWTKGNTIVSYQDKEYFWNSYHEGDGRYKMFKQKIYTLDKSNTRTFDASTESFFGKLKYHNPTQDLKVVRFDKSIEEWDVHAIGAPHVGGIFFPDPAKIWYYEVLKNEETILQFKVRENDNDNLKPFNYLTNKKEFYLYDLYEGDLVRVRLLE